VSDPITGSRSFVSKKLFPNGLVQLVPGMDFRVIYIGRIASLEIKLR